MKHYLFSLGVAIMSFCPIVLGSTTYQSHPEAIKFIDEMVVEHKFDKAALKVLFAKAEKKQSILTAIARPAEKTKAWFEYRKIFVTQKRIQQGVEFWSKNAKTLERAELEFGVPAAIIVSIIGVETRYGRNVGSYRVVDALSTLAFDYPKRSTFFRKELKQFLLLSREQNRQPLELIGSYAGAMGFGQFMPSSYRHYSVDFDGDGFNDIWENRQDAIGSVANYFKQHGWKKDAPITERVNIKGSIDKALEDNVINFTGKPVASIAELQTMGFESTVALPPVSKATVLALEQKGGLEYWLALDNFYVITRYNHSQLYAMSVYQLSEEIRQRYQAIKK